MTEPASDDFVPGLRNSVVIEEWPLERVVPYAQNPRKHSDAQVEQIAVSIDNFGFTVPILVNEAGVIIAGEGRYLAAIKRNRGTVPVIQLTHLTDEQVKAYRLADNAIPLNAQWDISMLLAELDALPSFAPPELGFDVADISAMRLSLRSPLQNPEDTPDPPAVPVSRLGDIWVLGDHRITCGDSTDKETVALLLAGAKPHLMVTDPPYGVNYDAEWRVAAGVNAPSAAHGKVMNDDRADWTPAWLLFPGDVAYVWHAGVMAGVVQTSLQAAGFDTRSQVVWNKSSMAIGRGNYHWKHEPCWYVVRKGATAHWAGDRKQTTVWDIDKPQKSETGHSTQKPVECMRRPILNNSKIGDAVYEPFSGSGTTIIACEMEGRRAYAIELNPAYVDVAVKRWQEFAGRDAVLASDGRTFADVAQERLQATVPEAAE